MSRCFFEFQLSWKVRSYCRLFRSMILNENPPFKGLQIWSDLFMIVVLKKNSRIKMCKKNTEKHIKPSISPKPPINPKPLPLGNPQQTFRESLGLAERFTTSRALGTSLSTHSTCCTRSFSSLVFMRFTMDVFWVDAGGEFVVRDFLVGGESKTIFGTSLALDFFGCVWTGLASRLWKDTIFGGPSMSIFLQVS